jgi:Icc protein
MTRIAHASDLHLLEDGHQRRDAAGRLRLSFLSFGRRLDADDRRARLRAVLRAYRGSSAEHLVVTGDLTEDGTREQFGVLAEVLLDSGIDPREVTLVPGNHDAYYSPSAFAEALDGPLRPFLATSGPDALTVMDDVAIVPVSTVMFQPITRSAGVISGAHLRRIEAASHGFKGSRRALAIAQHHQPYGYSVSAFNWVDGLQNHASATGLLEGHKELHVLHGHRHRTIDRAVGGQGPARVFGTTACVDHPSPLRLYEACNGRLWPLEQPGSTQLSAVVVNGPSLAAASA